MFQDKYRKIAFEEYYQMSMSCEVFAKDLVTFCDKTITKFSDDEALFHFENLDVPIDAKKVALKYARWCK